MIAADPSTRVRWTTATGVALLSTVAILCLFRTPKPVVHAPVAPSSTVALTAVGGESNAALNEEALLFDPTPLFLPTEWNAAQAMAQKNAAVLEPGTEFAGFEPNWHFLPNELAVGLAAPIAVPENGAALLSTELPPRFVGLGREDIPIQPLESRGARLEIRAGNTGQLVLALTLADAHPPGDGLWRPVQLDAAVDAAGLIGALVVSQRSDVDGVDNYFRSYLAESRHLGQLLSPGFYRIIVGP